MFNQKKKEEEEEEEISVYEKARLAEQQRQLEDQKRQLQIAQARRQQVLRQEYYEELQRYEEEIEREEHLLNGINKWREERAWNMKYELWYYPDRISWIPRPSLPTVEAEAERQNKERKSMIEMDKALLRAVQNSMSDSEYNRYRKRLKAPEGIGRELGLDGLGLRQEELPPPREPLDDEGEED